MENSLIDEDGNADFQAAAERYKKEVQQRASEIDPGEEFDWESLTVGWAIGKGMDPKGAGAFANYLRRN